MLSVSAMPEERELGKAYREFSRRRYLELKASGSIVRESELVQIIIREWDSMTLTQRMKYLPENLEPLSTPAKISKNRVPLDIKNKSNAKTTGRKPASEEGEQREAMELPAEQAPVRDLEKTPVYKTKAIGKSTKRQERIKDYISFYRFQYKRIMEQHPNWNSAKASIIIGLRWKKEKQDAERIRRARNIRKTHLPRKMSGRVTFRKAMVKEGLNSMNIVRKWKRLPSDSKRMWERMGDPSATARVNRSHQSTMVKLAGGESSELMSLMGKK